MRTLGVDLSAQAARTAVCEVVWEGGRGRVVRLEVGVDDRRVGEWAEGCERVGIDAPFGWPAAFVAMMARHHGALGDAAGGSVVGVPEWSPAQRDQLRFRRTDVVVRGALGRWPLSVSSDLIAIVAMRCAGLLDRLGVRDRSGTSRVVEVYPAVALAVWGLPHRGYKGGDVASRAVLAGLVAAVGEGCRGLEVPADVEDRCRSSDHAFDALVAALVARAAFLGLVGRPGPEDAVAAREEGWIAVPRGGSLGQLVG